MDSRYIYFILSIYVLYETIQSHTNEDLKKMMYNVKDDLELKIITYALCTVAGISISEESVLKHLEVIEYSDKNKLEIALYITLRQHFVRREGEKLGALLTDFWYEEIINKWEKGIETDTNPTDIVKRLYLAWQRCTSNVN